jgi:hypothetical protein
MSSTKVQVKERPIIFSGDMVRAILEGRKTQTRREIKPQPDTGITMGHQDGAGGWIFWTGPVAVDMAAFTREAYPNGGGFLCPYGKPGDRLWVREALRLVAGRERDLSCAPLATGRWIATWRARPVGDDLAPVSGRLASPIGRATFEITAGAETRLDLELPSAATLRVALSWALDGVVAVELVAEEGTQPLALVRAALEKGRHATFAGLAPGRYSLALCAQGGGRWPG